MSRIKSRVMQLNFTKFFKRFILAVVCTVVLCSVATGITCHTQINEVISYEESAKMNDVDTGQMESKFMKQGEVENDGKKGEQGDFSDMILTEPTTGAKIVAGISILVVLAAFITYWLALAVWMYQAAEKSGLHSFLWLVFTLIGNLFAVVLFLLVRNFLCTKCAACGKWQHRRNRYCVSCGKALELFCTNCGAQNKQGEHYCAGCGEQLDVTAAKKE